MQDWPRLCGHVYSHLQPGELERSAPLGADECLAQIGLLRRGRSSGQASKNPFFLNQTRWVFGGFGFYWVFFISMCSVKKNLAEKEKQNLLTDFI